AGLNKNHILIKFSQAIVPTPKSPNSHASSAARIVPNTVAKIRSTLRRFITNFVPLSLIFRVKYVTFVSPMYEYAKIVVNAKKNNATATNLEPIPANVGSNTYDAPSNALSTPAWTYIAVPE